MVTKARHPQPIATTAPALWTVLARAFNALATASEHALADQDIGLSDFAVLEVLLHKGPLPMSTIAEKVLLANASMTSAVDRLDDRGLVTRCAQTGDRRVRLVDLTPAGRKLIKALFPIHAQRLEAIMAGLSTADRAHLRRSLKTIGLAAEAAVGRR